MALSRHLTRSLTSTRPLLLHRPIPIPFPFPTHTHTPTPTRYLIRTLVTPTPRIHATQSTALLEDVKAREEADGVEVVLRRGGEAGKGGEGEGGKEGKGEGMREGEGVGGFGVGVGVRKVVMEGGKGSEGRHSKDGLIPVISDDLSDKTRTGPWTISHPIYTLEELESVQVVRRERKTLGDKIASGLVSLCRTSFDLVTFYRHKPIPDSTLNPLTTTTATSTSTATSSSSSAPTPATSTALTSTTTPTTPTKPLTVKQLRDGGYILTPDQWLSRILMLESVAGVPGMVAGVVRHLRSLRLMRRDGGWIHTLLSEAENERMHLLTFMTIKQPSILFRAFVLGIQGVFFNIFFLSYLISPSAAHRFVGYLEEEACITYTRCIEDMKRGWIPEWEDVKAPGIAIDYWRLPEDAMLLDVIKAVRADEATHRFVNHTLANLDQQLDFNPFALKEPDPVTRGTVPGFSREEAAEFARQAHEEQARLP